MTRSVFIQGIAVAFHILAFIAFCETYPLSLTSYSSSFDSKTKQKTKTRIESPYNQQISWKTIQAELKQLQDICDEPREVDLSSQELLAISRSQQSNPNNPANNPNKEDDKSRIVYLLLVQLPISRIVYIVILSSKKIINQHSFLVGL
jgi:hypothetical protein